MAPTTTGTAHALNSAPSSREIFQFLELSHELRDMVYDSGLDDRDFVLRCHIKIRAMNVARTKFLTLNHQIKIEYEERVAKQAMIHLYDDFDFDFTHFDLPPGAARVPRVELHLAAKLIASLVEPKNDLPKHDINHSTWINRFIQRHPDLEVLSIVINYESHNAETTDVMIALNASFWPRIPQLKALKVRDAFPRATSRSRYDMFGVFDFSREDPLLLEWSSKTRKVELVA